MHTVQLALSRIPPFAINRPELGSLKEIVATKTALFRTIAVLLAILHAALALTAAVEKSPTFDEPTHLTAGYTYWLKNDYRLDPENGNWSGRWAALPLLWSHPGFVENMAWKNGDVGPVSEKFFYFSGNDSDCLVLQGRSMMATVGAALCLLIFFCSARLFGPIGGLISELLAVFDPNLLAHSGLITADAAAALLFTAATWSYFRLLEAITLRRFLITALSWSALFLAKMSAPAILFVAAIIAAVRIFSPGPLPWISSSRRQIAGLWRKLIVVSSLTAALLAIVALTIWGSFGFRFFAFPENAPARAAWNEGWDACLSEHTILENVIGFARDHKLFPEAYLYGFAVTNKSAMFRQAFLDGEWSNTGFGLFFPRAFIYKTPLPVLFLLLASVVAAFLRWKPSSGSNIRNDLARLTPIWALLLVYAAFSFSSHLNIGHRHLLPIYPALFIACGACTCFFHARSALAIFTGVMLCWQIAESSSVRPDYLAYFNQIAGGPKNGYRHLVDSSLDWGQDLPALERWLDRNYSPSAGELYLAYFGTASPRWYGIEATALPVDTSRAEVTMLKPGVYCISATILEQVYSFQPGKWRNEYESEYRRLSTEWLHRADPTDNEPWPNKERLEYIRFARLCAYLRQRQPVANLGNSILVFRLSQRELDQALYGPPAELASTTLVHRAQ